MHLQFWLIITHIQHDILQTKLIESGHITVPNFQEKIEEIIKKVVILIIAILMHIKFPGLDIFSRIEIEALSPLYRLRH